MLQRPELSPVASRSGKRKWNPRPPVPAAAGHCSHAHIPGLHLSLVQGYPVLTNKEKIATLTGPPIFNIFIWLRSVTAWWFYVFNLLGDNNAYFIPFNSELQNSEVIVLSYKNTWSELTIFFCFHMWLASFGTHGEWKSFMEPSCIWGIIWWLCNLSWLIYFPNMVSKWTLLMRSSAAY